MVASVNPTTQKGDALLRRDGRADHPRHRDDVLTRRASVAEPQAFKAALQLLLYGEVTIFGTHRHA